MPANLSDYRCDHRVGNAFGTRNRTRYGCKAEDHIITSSESGLLSQIPKLSVSLNDQAGPHMVTKGTNPFP